MSFRYRNYPNSQISHQQIFQGVLGDCWLLSTCAALAKKEELMYRVIDPNQVLYGPGYTGLVRVNVWRYGHWVTVYIDDRYTLFNQAQQILLRILTVKAATAQRLLLLC